VTWGRQLEKCSLRGEVIIDSANIRRYDRHTSTGFRGSSIAHIHTITTTIWATLLQRPLFFKTFRRISFPRLGALKTPDEEGVTIYHVTLSGEKHPIPWSTFLGSPGSRNITREKPNKFGMG
jgi:hypothetical protein